MQLDDINGKMFSYYIAEDNRSAAERLQHEMQQYPDWQFAGTAVSVKQAIREISSIKPDLIFCDWDLVGGSGFEILQDIQNTSQYDPFIIFNTGFQSDHPEIAEELVNTYKPDAYINKPYWDKLRQQLPELLRKAKLKIQQPRSPAKVFWLTDIHGKKFSIVPQQIQCILQSEPNPRAKIFYTETNPSGKEAIITWKEAIEFLQSNSITFFVTNKRYSIVIKNFIESYNKPWIYLKGSRCPIEIVPDYIKAFEEWLEKDK